MIEIGVPIIVPLALSAAALVVIAVLRRRIVKSDAARRDPVVDVTMQYGLDAGEHDRMIREALALVEAHLRAGRSFTLRYRHERQAPGA